MKKKLNIVTSSKVYKPEKSQNWYYSIYYYIDNVRKHEMRSTGLKATRQNRKEAERIRLDRVRELEEMTNLAAKNWYFHDFVKNWYENVIINEVKENTYYNYRSPYKYVMEYFSMPAHQITLPEITPLEINQFYAYLKKHTDLSPNTITGKVRMILHSSLECACECGLIASNPVTHDRPPKKVKIRRNALTVDQLRQLLDYVKGTKMEAPIWLAARFGLRRSEAVGLKWESIDFDRMKMVIKDTAYSIRGQEQKTVEDTKNDSSKRVLDITDKDVSELKRIRSWQSQLRLKSGNTVPIPVFVCCDEYGQQMKLDYISKATTKALNVLGIRGVTYHSLRHSVASMLLNSGMKLWEVSNMLGHSQFSTTVDIYGHWSSERQEETAQTLSMLINQ